MRAATALPGAAGEAVTRVLAAGSGVGGAVAAAGARLHAYSQLFSAKREVQSEAFARVEAPGVPQLAAPPRAASARRPLYDPDAERRKAARMEEARAAMSADCSFRPAVNRARPSSAAPALQRSTSASPGGALAGRRPFASPLRGAGGEVAARVLLAGETTRARREEKRVDKARRETEGLTFQPDVTLSRSGRASPASFDGRGGGGGGAAAAAARLWEQSVARREEQEKRAVEARVREELAEGASLRRKPEISADSRRLADQAKGKSATIDPTPPLYPHPLSPDFAPHPPAPSPLPLSSFYQRASF